MARRAAIPAIPALPEQGPVSQEPAQEWVPRAALDPLVREARFLLRERIPVIWITTHEEFRIGVILAVAAAAESYKIRYWNCATGALDLNGEEINLSPPPEPGAPPAPVKPKTLPAAVFDKIRRPDERAVWVLNDLHDWMRDPTVVRGLKQLSIDLRKDIDKGRFRVVFIVSHSDDIPLNLRNSIGKWDLPLPKQDELAVLLGDVLERGRKPAKGEVYRKHGGSWNHSKLAPQPAGTTDALEGGVWHHGEELPEPSLGRDGDLYFRIITPEETSEVARQRYLGTTEPEELRRITDAVLGAALGLTAEDATAAFGRSITRTKKVDPGIVAAEKKRIVDREKGVTWYKPDPRGLAALGGLDLLKEWFLEQVQSLSPDAKE